MLRSFLSGISEKNARVSIFIFFGLLFLSVTFFVSADDTATNKNIFQDSDQDGLSNDEEALYKTDPLDKDSDDDSYSDSVEVESGYDPLKPAPGDRLVETATDSNDSTDTTVNRTNLTSQVSAEIASVVKSGAEGEEAEVTMETINEAVQNVLNQTDQEIILPEVSADEIKIKEIPKKLKGNARTEREREDALEYLTVMAYVLANNSPKKLQSESDLESLASSMGTSTLSAMALGDTDYLEDLAKKAEKSLKEIKDIEVPVGMVDVHLQAIKMTKYAMTFKDESKKVNVQNDPLGQIAVL